MRSSRRIRRLVSACTIPDPWSIEAFVAAVGRDSGRDIELVPSAVAGGSITGSVLRLPHVDVIVVRDDLEGVYRDHVVCHEVAHILAGHLDGAAPVDADIAVAASHMLHRGCDSDNANELEAEAIAEGLMRRAHRASGSGYESALW